MASLLIWGNSFGEDRERLSSLSVSEVYLQLLEQGAAGYNGSGCPIDAMFFVRKFPRTLRSAGASRVV